MEDCKTKKSERYSLPKIRELKPTLRKYVLTETEQQKQNIYQLEAWENSLPSLQRENKNKGTESILFLYRNSENKRTFRTKNKATTLQEKQFASITFFLTQIDSELNKIKKINYSAIYQNIQYCKGVYENAFNYLLKELAKQKQFIKDTIKGKVKRIIDMREELNTNLSMLTAEKIKKKKQKKLKMCLEEIEEREKEKEKENEREKEREKEKEQKQDKQAPVLLEKKIDFAFEKDFKFPSEIDDKITEKIDLEDMSAEIEYLRERIEKTKKQVEIIERFLTKVQDAQIKVLKFSLQQGFDVRNQGLVWILNQLADLKLQKNQDFLQLAEKQQNWEGKKKRREKSTSKIQMPEKYQYPSFLNEEEISFLTCKLGNNFKIQKHSIQKEEKLNQNKTIVQQAFDNLQRQKKRRMTLIKQNQVLQKLNEERKSQKIHGHKYLEKEALKLITRNQSIKSTKYQLIYKQTMRKLKRLCVEQIYGKQEKQEPKKSRGKSRRGSKVIRNSNFKNDSIVGQIKTMLSTTHKMRQEEAILKSEEDSKLALIIKKLKKEKYEDQFSGSRNPITVMCALVGWKKATIILKSEMNIFLPQSL